MCDCGQCGVKGEIVGCVGARSLSGGQSGAGSGQLVGSHVRPSRASAAHKWPGLTTGHFTGHAIRRPLSGYGVFSFTTDQGFFGRG